MSFQGDQATIKHFSHTAHPLQLISNHQNCNPTVPTSTCSGCKSQAIGTVYSCRTCNYFLHPHCAKMPREITHPFDKGHVFTLVSHGEGLYNYCDACGKQAKGFCYHCKICRIDLHMLCASTPLTYTHQSHPDHKLKLLFSPSHHDKKFMCHVCNTLGSDHWLYRCDICDFDVHLDCKNVPIQQENMRHHHHQTTFGGFPNQSHIPQPHIKVQQPGYAFPQQAPYFQPFNPAYATGVPMNQGIDPAVLDFIQKLQALSAAQSRMYQHQPYAHAHMAGGGFGGGHGWHGGGTGAYGHHGGNQNFIQTLFRLSMGFGSNIPGLDLLANGGGGNLSDVFGGDGVLSFLSGFDLGSLAGVFGF